MFEVREKLRLKCSKCGVEVEEKRGGHCDLCDIERRVKGLRYHIDFDLYLIIEWMFSQFKEIKDGRKYA